MGTQGTKLSECPCVPRTASPQPHRVSFCTFEVGTCHCSSALSWRCWQQPGPQEPSSPWVQVEGLKGPFQWLQDGDVRVGGGDEPYGGERKPVGLWQQECRLAQNPETPVSSGHVGAAIPPHALRHVSQPGEGSHERSFSFQGALTPEKNTCGLSSLMPHLLLQAGPAPKIFHPTQPAWGGAN